MKYILDTNVVVRLLDADERVLAHLADVDPRDVGIPLLVVAELFFGAEKSARREPNRARVQRLDRSLSFASTGTRDRAALRGRARGCRGTGAAKERLRFDDRVHSART